MKIEHLYYYLVIVDSKSINKAAQRLFISQQHLSRIMVGLEKELNVVLFKRLSTGIKLTSQGRIFFDYAKKIVSTYNEMKNEFYLDALPEISQETVIKGTCTLSFPFFFSLYLNDFIKKLNTEYSEISLHCFENYGVQSVSELERGKCIHLISDSKDKIESLFAEQEQLIYFYIGETGLSFCVNKDFPLADKRVLTKDDISMHMITNYPQADIDNVFLEHSQILFTSSNIYQHLDSVTNNNSICFVPNYLREGVMENYPDIRFISYEQTFSIPMYIVYSEKFQMTDVDKAVIRFLARYIQNLIVADNDRLQYM